MKNEKTDQERSALDRLFSQTEIVARGQVARTGKIDPAMVLMTSDNRFIDLELRQLQFLDQNGKLQEIVQAVCIEANVVASTMLFPNTLTAKDHDTQEVAVILGGTKTLREERAMPIMRRACGHFIGFGNTLHLPHFPESEKFQSFIPKEMPTMAERLRAKAVLRYVGMKVSRPCDHGHHPYREKKAQKDEAQGFCL